MLLRLKRLFRSLTTARLARFGLLLLALLLFTSRWSCGHRAPTDIPFGALLTEDMAEGILMATTAPLLIS